MKNTTILLDPIEEAIEEIRVGKIIIVVDDEQRENEGDFIFAAEKATPETINFVITHGRGLVCVPLPEKRCNDLNLPLMVTNNTDPKGTSFTVSVDLRGQGISTGISTSDRAKTIQALVDPKIEGEAFNKPGHIFPLRAKEGGVLKRPGHTEAAVDLTEMAGCIPGGVVVEILHEDGSMARLSDLIKIAKGFQMKIISVADLIAYKLKKKNERALRMLHERRGNI
ncbi:MAG: 3,4-dihydroxy-2-butanone-4-phosphate synthase [Flavobacteriales bacterium Tduv]